MKYVVLLVMILLGSNVATASMLMTGFDRASGDAMDHMDAAMKAAPMNGNPDHDFLVMMIPHHEGAIEMAQSELQYGHDVYVKRLAQEIIVSQQSEKQLMQSYLASASRSQKGKN